MVYCRQRQQTFMLKNQEREIFMMKRLIALALLTTLLLLCLISCAPAKPITRGTIEENVYTNADLGITFTKPSGWTFYSDEQIREITQISIEEILKDDQYDPEKMTYVMDFMAADIQGNNVNLSIESLNFLGKTMTEEKYIEKSKETLNEQDTLTYTFSDTAEVTLAGTTFSRLTATATYQTVSMTQYIYVKKLDGYMLCITATAVDTIPAEDFEAMFS